MVSEELSETLFPLINEVDGDEDQRDILSPQLRANFRKLRTFLAPQEENSLGKRRENLSCNESDRKKRKQSSASTTKKGRAIVKANQSAECTPDPSCKDSEHDFIDTDDILAEQVHLAAHTLVTAENEIAMLRKGIAELESLLELNEDMNCTNIKSENIDNNKLGTMPVLKPSSVNVNFGFDCEGQTIIQTNNPTSVFEMGEN